MVSMKDIARRCGVSVATVSKALNDQPDIGKETREKIHKVAAEMGYVTNSAARALKANRTFNVGILFVDEQNSGLTHEYFSSMLESLKVEVESRGYDGKLAFLSHTPRLRWAHLLASAAYVLTLMGLIFVRKGWLHL